MYLLIFEDFTVQSTDVLTNSEFQAADAGVLDIIDIRDPTAPMQYTRSHEEPWIEVERY